MFSRQLNSYYASQLAILHERLSPSDGLKTKHASSPTKSIGNTPARAVIDVLMPITEFPLIDNETSSHSQRTENRDKQIIHVLDMELSKIIPNSLALLRVASALNAKLQIQINDWGFGCYGNI